MLECIDQIKLYWLIVLDLGIGQDRMGAILVAFHWRCIKLLTKICLFFTTLYFQKVVYCRFTWRPEKTIQSHFNATNFIKIR